MGCSVQFKQWVLVAALSLTSSLGFAQAFPDRPIKIVVPSAAGGSTDTIFRTLAVTVASLLKTQVVIDNRPGAGGNIASDLVAKSKPDGYTLLAPFGGFAINATLYPRLSFDPVKDFAPVIQVCNVTGILVVNPNVPAKSVRDLIGMAKAKPEGVTFASAGVGTVTHLAGELFNSMAGTRILHVPYKGSSFAETDLLSGQVQVMFANIPGTLQHVQAGKLRVLAVNSAQRSALLPDVPTVAESGLPGYEAGTWFGVMAPAGTPADVVAKLNAAFAQAIKTPEMLAFLTKEGATPVGGSPEQFGQFVNAEIDKWGRIVKATGATAN